MKKIRILAVICALLTAAAVYLYLESQKKPVIIEKKSVLVAASNISPYTPITEDMITLAQIPTEAVVQGAISDPETVVGKVSRSAIYAGEQLIGEKFVAAGGESGARTLAYAIEPGMRAMTISVGDTSGLAYMIKPGNRIDIIGHFIVEEEPEVSGEETEEAQPAPEKEKNVYTVMVFENIRVLAVDSVLSELGKTGEGAGYSTLTLELTPQQALELSSVLYEGDIRIIMRSPVDSEETDLTAIKLEDAITIK
ncbi:MAG: Flp pilus assembly protein CpaB [Clostridiales bacterium]|nr:Flp pilus assembly protein CpaB [Clostridiales bacterium]